MRHTIPALLLTAAVTLGPSRAAVSARPATPIRDAVPGLSDLLSA